MSAAPVANRMRCGATLSIGVGISFSFVCGDVPRAPLWMRKSGLEWLHRLLSEPRRLLKRYAHDAWFFPALLWREWRLRPVVR